MRTKAILCLYFLVCLIVFIVRTAHWKQVNDPAQLNYLCFLMDHGMAPYRDLLEVNMPGTYLVNWSVMHTLGGGSAAWRFFDLSLMGIAAWAMIVVARPYGWLAGALGATMFTLFHGKDGAGQQGQRDLMIAVLLLCAYAFLFTFFRRRQHWALFGFGICAGIASTIKPIPLPFAFLLIVLTTYRLWSAREPVVRPLFFALLGLCLPLLGVFSFLAVKHSLGAFWYLLRVEMPFYTTLGRVPTGKLLSLMASPAIRLLALTAVAVAVIKRESWNWEISLLVIGILFGAASFFAQGKAFPYHRYPLVGFLFLWIAIEFIRELKAPGAAGRLALGGVIFALALLPVYVNAAAHKEWDPSYINSLSADLNRLGGSRLSGHVQCIDMPADCDNTLYRMQLVQSTGLFYDYLVFGSTQQRVVRDLRGRFWQEFEKNKPHVIVVGSGLYPYGQGYDKLASWPWFQHELQDHYYLYGDRTFRRAEAGPRAYRIYVEKTPQPMLSNEAAVRLPSEAGIARNTR
jgi:hypothetical protein